MELGDGEVLDRSTASESVLESEPEDGALVGHGYFVEEGEGSERWREEKRSRGGGGFCGGDGEGGARREEGGEQRPVGEEEIQLTEMEVSQREGKSDAGIVAAVVSQRRWLEVQGLQVCAQRPSSGTSSGND